MYIFYFNIIIYIIRNYNEKNYKLLMENVDFKDKAIKFEKFMNDIDNLIDNSNNLISIPSLVEIFKKNLYDIGIMIAII